MTPIWARLQTWIEAPLDPAHRVALAIAAGLLVAVVTWAVARALLRTLNRLADRTRTDLDDELLDRMGLPGRLIGPIVGLHVGAAIARVQGIVGAAEIAEGLLATYIAIASFELLVVERWLQQRQGITVPPLVRQVVIGVVYGCVLLGVAGTVFGIDITPLLATGSVTTVVVGLALQQPLSNLFSGLMLHVEGHPKVGDWLLVDNREGMVLHIGWRTTRLRMFTDDVLVVPNASLANAQVINFSEPTKTTGRNLPVPVPLDIAPDVFLAWVREVSAQVDGMAQEPLPKTWLTAIDDHCQRYVVRIWVSDFRRHDDVESDFLKGLWTRFHREGVAFPTPFQAVRMVSENVPPAFSGLDPVRKPAPPPPAQPEPPKVS